MCSPRRCDKHVQTHRLQRIDTIDRLTDPARDELYTARNCRQLAKQAEVWSMNGRAGRILCPKRVKKTWNLARAEWDGVTLDVLGAAEGDGGAGSHPRSWHILNSRWHIPGPKQQNSSVCYSVAVHANVWYIGSWEVLFIKSCWQLVSACCRIQASFSAFAHSSYDLPVSCVSLQILA